MMKFLFFFLFVFAINCLALSEALDSAFARFDYTKAIRVAKSEISHSPTSERIIALADAYIYKTFTLSREHRLAIYDSARSSLIRHEKHISHRIEFYTRLSLISGQMASLCKPSSKGRLIYDMHRYTKQALKMDSTNALAVFLDGYLYYRLSILTWFEKLLARAFIGRLPDTSLEESRKLLTKSVMLDPNNAYFHFVLGRTLYVMKEFEEAESVLERALSCSDRNIIDRIHKEEARQYLRTLRAKKFTHHGQ